jgi:hypothetical protein
MKWRKWYKMIDIFSMLPKQEKNRLRIGRKKKKNNNKELT